MSLSTLKDLMGEQQLQDGSYEMEMFIQIFVIMFLYFRSAPAGLHHGQPLKEQ